MRRIATIPVALAALLTAAAGCAPHPASSEPAPAPAPTQALPSAARPAAASQRPATPPAAPLPSIATRAAHLLRHPGFIGVDLDTTSGAIYLEIPRDSARALYFLSLTTGLGSNPIGLDRGMVEDGYVAEFDRTGNRVLLVLENTRYRSSDSTNRANVRSVREAFPPSTVAAMPIVAVSDGRFMVDATHFFLSDWSDIVGTLARSGQGAYTLDRHRSSVYRPGTAAFPENSEVDVALTFTAQHQPGRIVSALVPDGRAFTLRQHTSFLALPHDGYRPRRADPRIGYFSIRFKDYGQPIDAALEQRWITRHPLRRVHPNDPASPIADPIIYYIDRGIPEPIRSAVKQGVSWWSEAFAKAGLSGAFIVRDLPKGVDPMDARYNVVEWVNRNEKGWSVGASLDDPRTGEIIKALVRLDSHRARTDYNLYAGLLGARDSAADTAFVLARIRQLAAHETGHTLGLSHNYIASTYGRGSVMDYPAPRVRLDADGRIDLSSAYATGPGAYDVWAIRWGYGIFPPGQTADSLRAIVAEGLRRGYLYLSDADARPASASDPRVNLWDDASSPVRFLADEAAVRRVALARFGLRNIRPGDPITLLQERFIPVYLMHRYAIASAAKVIGGVEYSHAVRGDGQQATRLVPPATQRAALHALVQTLAPAALEIPDTVLTLLEPQPASASPTDQRFASRTRPLFDEFGAARSLAQIVVDAVLQPARAARVVALAPHQRDPLTLGEVIDSLTASWGHAPPASPVHEALERVVQRAVADRLLTLAADTRAGSAVREVVDLEIRRLGAVAARAAARPGPTTERAHWMAIAGDFRRWTTRRRLPHPSPALRPPSGQPFGEAP